MSRQLREEIEGIPSANQACVQDDLGSFMDIDEMNQDKFYAL